jgi:hypothetical protein
MNTISCTVVVVGVLAAAAGLSAVLFWLHAATLAARANNKTDFVTIDALIFILFI